MAVLRRLVEEGGDNNFAIFWGDRERDYYAQVAATRGEPTLYGEAVGNSSLKKKYQFDESRTIQMEFIGWKRPGGGEPNFWRNWSPASDEERDAVAGMILRTLTEMYGVGREQEIEVELNLE